MKCSVLNCVNNTKTTKSSGITFHMFPSEPNLRSMWIAALGMMDWEPGKSSQICSEHFRMEDFYETVSGQREIRNDAIPVVTKDHTDELDQPAFERVCRICLAIDVKTYHFRENDLDKMYEQFTGILIIGKQRLPQRVCIECAARLTSALRFRNRALKSLELLQELLLDDDHVITIRDIISLNSVHDSCKSPLIETTFDNSHCDLQICDIPAKDGEMEPYCEVGKIEKNSVTGEGFDAEEKGPSGYGANTESMEPKLEFVKVEPNDEFVHTEETVVKYEDVIVDIKIEDTFEECTNSNVYEGTDHSDDKDEYNASNDLLVEQTTGKSTQQSSQGSQNVIETGLHQDQFNTRRTVNDIVKNNKKERQKRYREQNREKLKQREAERRKRIQYLRSIAGSTHCTNINGIELSNEEIITAMSQSSSGFEGPQPSSTERNKQSKKMSALEKKRERQQRYREQNRDKLKQREAERRRRPKIGRNDCLLSQV